MARRGTGVQPLTSRRRQSLSRRRRTTAWLQIQRPGEYFWKFTGGAYDFNTIPEYSAQLSHPVSEIEDRWSLARVTLNNVHGLSAPSPYWDTADRASSVRKLAVSILVQAYASVAVRITIKDSTAHKPSVPVFAERDEGPLDWSYLAV